MPGSALLRRVMLCIAVVCVVVAPYVIKRPSQAAPRQEAGKLRVVLFVNGTLGDKSFYDSAARGIRRAHETLGAQVRIVEGGTDPTRWEAALSDLAASAAYDVIVTGTFTMAAVVEKLSAQRPATHFVLFDAAVNYARCGCANVHSVLFRQNEGAYLAGHLAARLARLDRGNDAAVAIVGGMQIPVIEDYVVGFSAGARHADANVRILRQYTNSFTDPAAGKEAAKALMGGAAKATVLFTAAGASGHGVIEAAAEAGRHVIGVDADQYAVYKATQPARARAIASSVMKNVDVALERALRLHIERKLAYGHKESLGIAEGGVSLAPHSAVLAEHPELWVDVQQVAQEIAAGRLVAPSVWDAQGRLK